VREMQKFRGRNRDVERESDGLEKKKKKKKKRKVMNEK
jgi:hypothetical protein